MDLKPLYSIEKLLTDEIHSIEPGNFVEKMDQIYAWADEIIAYSIEANTRLYETPPLCSAGCSYCCHQLLVISYAEASYLYHKLKQSNQLDTVIKKIKDRIDIVEKTVQYNKIAAMELNENFSKYADIIRQYNHLELPCVFLISRKCAIYDFRPLTCRDAHVYDGFPPDCITQSSPVVRTLLFQKTYQLLADQLSLKIFGKTGGGEMNQILYLVYQKYN